MRLAVFGATGGTGMEIVKQAVERGHSVTAFVRSASRLNGLTSKVDVVEGDVFDAGRLNNGLAQHSAVLSALGPRNPRNGEPIVGPFARSLISAMRENGVPRLLILSVAFLFRDSVLPPAYPFGQLFFKHHVDDCAEMERIVEGSGLDWTIVRPPQLTDKPRTGKYRVLSGHLPFMGFTATRADVADFMLTAAEQDSYPKQVVGLAN
jgi:putative NADH-flavin reductase